MATETLAAPAVATSGPTRLPVWLRALLAGVGGAAIVAILGGAALLAYDTAWSGRILPGVRVVGLDLSGLDRAGATASLAAGLSAAGHGTLVVVTPDARFEIAYADLGRHVDVERMVDAAMAVGRSGTVVERAVAEIRVLVRGRSLEPRLDVDRRAVAYEIGRALAAAARPPANATISASPGGVAVALGRDGIAFDSGLVRQAALRALLGPSAGDRIEVEARPVAVPPSLTDAAVLAAADRAELVARDLRLTYETQAWVVPAATIRGWIHFAPRPDGSVRPVVDPADVAKALVPAAKAVDRAPVDATFLASRSGDVVGVTASRDGRAVDVPASVLAVSMELDARADGRPAGTVAVVVRAVAPKLTTDAVRKVAPLMVRLGWWRTWFPIGERNYYGANIWLPAQFINGTVLAPGAWFDWFRAIGPITRARGYGPGGYIAGDHTEPTGALAGGMCSSSTTLFNAALRAGLQMGERQNHRYYTDRYPLGLDATVYSGQSVTFRNDMAYPILIRGLKSRSGNVGYVTYEIWGVPDGRTVSISKPVVRNVLRARTIVEYTTALPPGARKQLEYPVNGMDVWVTRVVRGGSGAVIHHETWHSHYTLWNGLILVGAAR